MQKFKTCLLLIDYAVRAYWVWVLGNLIKMNAIYAFLGNCDTTITTVVVIWWADYNFSITSLLFKRNIFF